MVPYFFLDVSFSRGILPQKKGEKGSNLFGVVFRNRKGEPQFVGSAKTHTHIVARNNPFCDTQVLLASLHFVTLLEVPLVSQKVGRKLDFSPHRQVDGTTETSGTQLCNGKGHPLVNMTRFGTANLVKSIRSAAFMCVQASGFGPSSSHHNIV